MSELSNFTGRAIATWFGSGLLPKAPGTWGSLAALPFAWVIADVGGPLWLAAATVAVYGVGTWATAVFLRTTDDPDPGPVVVDEVAGMWMTLILVPVDPLIYAFRRHLPALAGVVGGQPYQRRKRGDARRCSGGDLFGAGHMDFRDVDGLKMLDDEILAAAESLLDMARAINAKLVTAESCTGGLIAGALTAIAGSSDVVDRGFVTYSNDAKAEMLGVPDAMLHEHGAVSEQVARAMAYGALLNSTAEASIAVTGVAGPGGGSAEKPVGLVFIAAARRRNSVVRVRREIFPGDRTAVRRATVLSALDLLSSILK